MDTEKHEGIARRAYAFWLAEGQPDRHPIPRGRAAVLGRRFSAATHHALGTAGSRTLRWREPDSNHRSLSYDKLRNWLEKAPELCAQGQPRCVRTREMSGGAAILTIEWLDGDHRHARMLYRNPARRE